MTETSARDVPRGVPSQRSRAELAADVITRLTADKSPGTRLGGKAELRAVCGVSVGTFNEALRILQSRGVIAVRSGPGGGLFVAHQSALLRLGNEMIALDGVTLPVSEVVRVVRALDSLIVEDAAHADGARYADELNERLTALRAARDGELRTFLRASLEIFSTLIEMGPSTVLRSFARVLLNAQVLRAIDVEGPIAPQHQSTVDDHLDAVSALVHAVLRADAETARHIVRERDLAGFFAIAASDGR